MFAGGRGAGVEREREQGDWQLLSHVWPTKAPAKWEKGCPTLSPFVCVCVCVKNPDGPMKIIACLARFELQLRTWRMPVWARQGRARRGGSKRQDTSSKEVNVFFVYLSTATLPAALARKIAEHTRGAVDVS